MCTCFLFKVETMQAYNNKVIEERHGAAGEMSDS